MKAILTVSGCCACGTEVDVGQMTARSTIAISIGSKRSGSLNRVLAEVTVLIASGIHAAGKKGWQLTLAAAFGPTSRSAYVAHLRPFAEDKHYGTTPPAAPQFLGRGAADAVPTTIRFRIGERLNH